MLTVSELALLSIPAASLFYPIFAQFSFEFDWLSIACHIGWMLLLSYDSLIFFVMPFLFDVTILGNRNSLEALRIKKHLGLHLSTKHLVWITLVPYLRGIKLWLGHLGKHCGQSASVERLRGFIHSIN